MSRGPEQKFWTRVRDMWKGHAVRVEASIGGCDPGTPDSVLSVGGRGGWIETKVWPQPLEDTQLPWHMDAIQRGAYAMVLCEMPDRRVWIGSAEEYNAMIQCHLQGFRIRPEGVVLQVALKMIECALIGQTDRRKR